MTDLWPSLQKQKQTDSWADLTESASETKTETETEGDGLYCPHCKSSESVETIQSDLVCFQCGTILDTNIDETAEFRWYAHDSGNPDTSRCGFPINPLMPESSLGTMILDNGSRSSVMRRTKQYHLWNMSTSRENTLWRIFDSLHVRASNVGIGSAVIDDAKELFAQISASVICRGQVQRDAMLAACLWEAFRRHETPRLPKDLSEIFNIPLSSVTKGIKQCQQLIAHRKINQSTDTYTVPESEKTKQHKIEHVVATTTEADRASFRKHIGQMNTNRITSYNDFIEPFLTNLAIPRRLFGTLTDLVRTTCEKIEELDILPENTPPSLTASVIMFCCKKLEHPIDIAEVARVCGISVVTIQKCLKRICAQLT